MTELVCRGAWVLGSACGKCSRCIESAPDGARALFGIVAELRKQVPTVDEWDALWSWHTDRQHEHAGREDYADAQHHKERAGAIRPLTSFGKKETTA